jgi:DNA-binding response OmpR family regulator
MEKKRILLVDDDTVLTRSLKMGLEKTGYYEVCAENSGARGLAAVLEFKPDLMILDIMMPGIGGPEMANKLMEYPSLSSIPIIFMTSLVSAEEADRTDVKIGYRYIAKPATVDKIANRIEAELAKCRQQDAFRA